MSPRQLMIDDALAAHALDALLAWRPEELVMLAGHATHWGLTVGLFRRGQRPLLFVPALEPSHPSLASCDVRTYPWGERIADAWAVLEQQLAAVSSGLRVGARRGGAHTAPAGNAAEAPPLNEDLLLRMAPVDGTTVVNELLARKTPDEARRIRRANVVALRGLKAGIEEIAPGVSEVEIAATIEAEIQRGTGRDGISYARGWAAVQSGPNAAQAGRFSRSTARQFQAGDAVVIELATCVDGYWSDLTRTVTVDEASAVFSSVQTTLAAAREAALRTLRPGVPAREVDAAARGVIEAAGWGPEFTHATGHPTGFRYHDAGPVLAPDCTAILAAGMVLTIEPGIYSAEHGFGCRVEENVWITEDGYEVLSVDSEGPCTEAHVTHEKVSS